MYCPHCGKEVPEIADYCMFCGSKITGIPYAPTTYSEAVRPTEPAKKVSSACIGAFLLGFFLSIIGVILAVIIYNGDKEKYVSDPTVPVLIVSIIAMILMPVALIALFITMASTSAIIF